MRPPTQDEQAVLSQWLQLPRVRQIFRMDPERIERIFSAVKNRRTGKFKQGGGGFEYEVTIPESVAEITITNLNSQLQFYVDQDDWSMVKKSDARIQKEQVEAKSRADAAEATAKAERDRNDPVIQAAKAQAVRDKEIADEKAWVAEIERPLPGENEFNRLRRVMALKEERGRKRFPRSVPDSTPHIDTIRRTSLDKKLDALERDAFAARKANQS